MDIVLVSFSFWSFIKMAVGREKYKRRNVTESSHRQPSDRNRPGYNPEPKVSVRSQISKPRRQKRTEAGRLLTATQLNEIKEPI